MDGTEAQLSIDRTCRRDLALLRDPGRCPGRQIGLPRRARRRVLPFCGKRAPDLEPGGSSDSPCSEEVAAAVVWLCSEQASFVTGEARSIDVVARAIPAQKLALVRALQSQGDVVAVTGDGVNDVPALQAADIGIAMGERGTRSAREAGAIVLLDDNFRTIVSAIAEGRQLFRNLRLSFAYLLMVHIPLVATAALIPLAGYPLLYLPIHVVWLELIIHPTALLVFQEPATSTILEPVRPRE